MRLDEKLSSEQNFCSLITDGAMWLVEEMARKYDTRNRKEILQYVCAEMERRYPGNSLEYHLEQMKLRTTGDILDVIDVYLILMEIDPTTTFVRTPRKKKTG